MDATEGNTVVGALANYSHAGSGTAAALSPSPMTTPLSVAVTNATAEATAALLADYRAKAKTQEIFVVLSYGIMSSLCVSLACYLRHNRNVALKGDTTAARKILLPAFEPLIWTLALTTALFCGAVTTTLVLDTFHEGLTPLATDAIFCGRIFVLLMVVVYMVQKSVTVPALVRTVCISLVGGTYSLWVEFVLLQYSDDSPEYARLHHVVMLVAKSLLLVFFTYVFVYPPGRASKRSLREYIGFVYVYYAMTYTYTFLIYEGHLDEGYLMKYITTMWAALAPLFIWRVLSADTQHWRGMGQRAVSLQSLFRQKHNLNERVSSQGLHVLIEMHRKFIIDFAYLELKQRIGVGSTATVFNGVLHSKTPVAVKVYTPTEYHEETVAEFSQEAALCGALNHPNIVKFYGMCVCPPTICLVAELCQGSLDDVTKAVMRTPQHSNRQQQLINMAYMIDAARAVAYIHSFSPAFVHRDIKPSNFLVDAENTVKLTDFGESRSLPKSQMTTPPVSTSTMEGTSSFYDTSVSVLHEFEETSLRQPSGRRSLRPDDNLPPQLTVKGTVDYMAPEIIQGRAGVASYGEAADVYSLAITMWDILNPGKEKFPTIRNNYLHIFESVIEGKRPEMETGIHPTVREVIESAWHSDPRLRPSAQNIVNILESVQEEMFAIFAADLNDELDQEPLYNKFGDLLAKAFTAKQGTDSMLAFGFVGCQAEAVRLGNALMDTGLLHHAKHERPYEPGDELYFFDEDNINLCRPILAPGENTTSEELEECDVDDDERIDHLVPLPNTMVTGARTSSGHPSRRPKAALMSRRKHSSSAHTGVTTARSTATIYDNGICQCRKLGQRLEQPRNTSALKRRGFRRHRHKAHSEENILTAKLLGAENATSMGGLLSQRAGGDFDDFDAVDTSFQQHLDHDGGFA